MADYNVITPEEWRPVVGYEGWYEVSDRARFRRIRAGSGATKGKIKKVRVNKTGYAYVILSRGGKAKNYAVHRLVGLAFLPNPDNKPTINHINGVKTDNAATNLEWCTAQENYHHACNTLGVASLKLNATKVRLIREYRDGGMSLGQIATMFGVNNSTAGSVARRESWKHVA